jgi:hypothetical protein
MKLVSETAAAVRHGAMEPAGVGPSLVDPPARIDGNGPSPRLRLRP